MKKILKPLVWIVAYVLIVALAPSAHADGDRIISADGAYEYRVIGGFAELKNYLGEENPPLNPDGSYTIPSSVDGYEVRYLGDYLFAGKDVPAENVIIPDSVTYIGSEVFAYEEEVWEPGWEDSTYEYKGKMKNVTIPDSVVEIGDYAFHGAVSLEEVRIPDGVRTLGDYAFYNSGIKKVSFGSGLRKVGKYAFAACENLKTVQIPETVTSLGEGAFRYCPELKELNVNQNTLLGKYCYGVDYAGKPEKNHTLVFNVNKTVKSLPAGYAYNNNVPCAINLNTDKTYAATAIGLEFELRVDGKSVSDCKSSNKKVATASADGTVKFINRGSATISATDENGKTRSIKLVSYEQLKLNKTSVTVKKGKTSAVKISGKVHSINNKYTNTKIAKITSKKSADKLTIKGLKKGKTTLKVKVNGIKTFKIIVKVV